jgi:hypothetical protein
MIHLVLEREIAAIHNMPHGTVAIYTEGIRNASLERMAKLVKIVGMMLQTKVYLFWSES